MDGDKPRPVPRAQPIDPDEKTEILRELLTVERARLQNALDLEKSRNIVFPETTVIIKDIERLVSALALKAEDEPSDVPSVLETVLKATKTFNQDPRPLYPTRRGTK